MTVDEALAGLNGWFRWGNWAAHYFVDGKQSCKTQHSYAEGGMERGLEPQRPKVADLTPGGQPYGRVCQRCQKSVKEAAAARPNVALGKGPLERFFVGSR